MIRRLRLAQGLSQTTLARRAKIGRVTLVRLEHGMHDPTLTTLERLAKALRMKVRDLIPR
jgi:transcriptional regulator with XRE-family HTH domain